jgi:hypothetical protein
MAAVVVITTHGDIQVRTDPKNPDRLHNVEKIQLPREMTIVSLNAVPVGSVNLLPPDQIKAFISIVRKNTNGFTEDSTKDQMKDMVELIREEMKELDHQPCEAAKEVHKKNPSFTEDPEILAYHYCSHELLYKMKSYSSRETYNKQFSREDHLLYRINYEGKRVMKKNSDWRINLLGKNITQDVDLMDVLNTDVAGLRSKSTRTTSTVTRLSDIIEFLLSHGIRKLILIDLSCSVFRDRLYGISARERRLLRFEDLKEESPESSNPTELAELTKSVKANIAKGGINFKIKTFKKNKGRSKKTIKRTFY